MATRGRYRWKRRDVVLKLAVNGVAWSNAILLASEALAIWRLEVQHTEGYDAPLATSGALSGGLVTRSVERKKGFTHLGGRRLIVRGLADMGVSLVIAV